MTASSGEVRWPPHLWTEPEDRVTVAFEDGSAGVLFREAPLPGWSTQSPESPDAAVAMSSGGHSDVWRAMQETVPAGVPSWMDPVRGVLVAPGFTASATSEVLVALMHDWVLDNEDREFRGGGLPAGEAFEALLAAAAVPAPTSATAELTWVWRRVLEAPFLQRFVWNRATVSPPLLVNVVDADPVRFGGCLFDVDVGDGSVGAWRCRLLAESVDQAGGGAFWSEGRWWSGGELVDAEALRVLSSGEGLLPSEMATDWLGRAWRACLGVGVDPRRLLDPTPVWLQVLVDASWSGWAADLVGPAAHAVLHDDRALFVALTGAAGEEALGVVDALVVDGVVPPGVRPSGRTSGRDDGEEFF